MILLALLLPVLMIGFLFAADALENLLFPPLVAQDDEATGGEIVPSASP